MFSLWAFSQSPSLSSADQCQLFYPGHQCALQQPLEGICCWWGLELKWCEYKVMRLMCFLNTHLHVCTHREHRIHTFRWVILPTKAVTEEVPHITMITKMLTTSLELISGNCLWAAHKMALVTLKVHLICNSKPPCYPTFSSRGFNSFWLVWN